MRVKYEEKHLFDPTFYPVNSWTEHRQVDFKCIPMSWTTKWLRVIFVIPKAGPEVKNWNTDQTMREYCLKEEGSFLTSNSGYQMQYKGRSERRNYFVNGQTFSNNFRMEFDQPLNGINTMSRTFHSTYLENGPDDDENYNQWNFTNNFIWDSLNN
jgi:hypothetical protein